MGVDWSQWFNIPSYGYKIPLGWNSWLPFPYYQPRFHAPCVLGNSPWSLWIWKLDANLSDSIFHNTMICVGLRKMICFPSSPRFKFWPFAQLRNSTVDSSWKVCSRSTGLHRHGRYPSMCSEEYAQYMYAAWVSGKLSIIILILLERTYDLFLFLPIKLLSVLPLMRAHTYIYIYRYLNINAAGFRVGFIYLADRSSQKQTWMVMMGSLSWGLVTKLLM